MPILRKVIHSNRYVEAPNEAVQTGTTSFSTFAKIAREAKKKATTSNAPKKVEALQPEAVQTYIDGAIREWRKKRDEATDLHVMETAAHYIDAFQSVRLSLLGETLEENLEEIWVRRSSSGTTFWFSPDNQIHTVSADEDTHHYEHIAWIADHLRVPRPSYRDDEACTDLMQSAYKKGWIRGWYIRGEVGLESCRKLSKQQATDLAFEVTQAYAPKSVKLEYTVVINDYYSPHPGSTKFDLSLDEAWKKMSGADWKRQAQEEKASMAVHYFLQAGFTSDEVEKKGKSDKLRLAVAKELGKDSMSSETWAIIVDMMRAQERNPSPTAPGHDQHPS